MDRLSTLLRQDRFSLAHLVVVVSATLFGLASLLRKPKRPSKIPKHTEKVLILAVSEGRSHISTLKGVQEYVSSAGGRIWWMRLYQSVKVP